jgi:hypothetical protein
VQDAGDGQFPVRFQGADQLGRARAPVEPIESTQVAFPGFAACPGPSNGPPQRPEHKFRSL